MGGKTSKEVKRRYRERNKEALRARKRARYDANVDTIKRTERERFLVNNYGITIAQFEEMEKAQDGLCFICGRDNKPLRLNVDHCHQSGVVRGLLCGRCNGALGWFEKHAAKVPVYLMRAPVFKSQGAF